MSEDLAKWKEKAKNLFMQKDYNRAYLVYTDCLKLCKFKSDIALILNNMS